ncbi:MAG: hypothetical protein V4443_11890 [Pseudomonadota bacterium]
MFSYSNWSVLTVSFLVVLYLALSGVTLCAVLYLAGAKWRNQIRHLASALYALFPLAFVLLLILLAGGSNTFAWLNAEMLHGPTRAVFDANLQVNAPEEMHHLPAWHNYAFLVARQIVGLLIVMGIYWVFIKRQKVSDRSEADKKRFHNIACVVPYTFVLYATMIAWDFEMTQVPSWHSAIYAMQHFVSNFGMFLSFLFVWIYTLNTRNKLVRPIDHYIYNFIAQMMLAFTLLWTYTFFAQYLVIWYGNFPEERNRIMGMQNGDFTALWWSMVALKFVIPFTMLAQRPTRHTPGAILIVACCIITGTVFERFNWIAGVNGTGTIPVITFIAVSVVVFTAGFFLVRGAMRRAQLIRV